jgi:hypothetical protein
MTFPLAFPLFLGERGLVSAGLVRLAARIVPGGIDLRNMALVVDKRAERDPVDRLVSQGPSLTPPPMMPRMTVAHVAAIDHCSLCPQLRGVETSKTRS